MSQGSWGWDSDTQQTSWNNQYGTPTLHSPAYPVDVNSRNTDPYYSQSQVIDVPVAASTYNNLPPTNTTTTLANNRSTSQQFKSNMGSNAGGVEGLDPSRWANKDTATNCILCEAPFSTLSKRKHNCRVCGNVFCGNCSADKLLINMRGLERVCFLCYSAHCNLTREEQKTIAEVCEELGEYPQMQTMVFRKKDSGPSSRHHAMLVISRYKLICMRRSSPKSNILKLSLLDLNRISMPKAGMLILEFGRQSGVSIVEQYETAKAPELLLTIRTQHALITLGMPDHCQLVTDAPPEGLLAMSELPKVGIAGGFIEAYRAWSNFNGTAASEELIQFVSDAVERTPFILDLSFCPGIEPGSNIAFDLKPVFQALKYNSYFLGLRLCDVTASGVTQFLAPCLKVNRVLTRLHLRKLVTKHMTLLGSALSENGLNLLQEIDLSGTRLSEKAVRSLALSIVCKEYGLKSFKVANCQLTARSVGVIIREGFLPSPEVTMTLEELDISENRMDEEGSLLLQVWLSKLSKRSTLKKLNISKTNALLSVVVPALELTFQLESVNLSHCTMDIETASSFAAIVANSLTLHEIDFSHCNLPAPSVAGIVSALLKNHNLPQGKCKIFAGGNNVDEISANLLISSIVFSKNLHTLDFSEIKLSEKSILDLFAFITANLPTLQCLILKDFFKSITQHIPGARVGHALADLILQVPSIKLLDISLLKLSLFSSTGSSSVIVPFLQRMQRNETLLELNVKGYKLGDKLAVSLADMLRVNTTLIVLNCDDNRITLTGFQALEYAMHRNRTLQSYIYPTGDVRRSFKRMTAPDKQHILFTILSNIQLACYFNQHNNGKHSYIQDTNYDPPPSGAILTYTEQAAPPTSRPQSTTTVSQETPYAVSGEYLVSQTNTPLPSLAPAHRPAPPPPPVATDWSSSASSVASYSNNTSSYTSPSVTSYSTPSTSSYTPSSTYSTPSTSTYTSTSRNSDFSAFNNQSNDFSSSAFTQPDFALNSSSAFSTPSAATSTTGDARSDDLFSTLASVLAADADQTYSNSATNNYSNNTYW